MAFRAVFRFVLVGCPSYSASHNVNKAIAAFGSAKGALVSGRLYGVR
ncbi:MAG: hypothetical protein QW780_05695 [Sulfolobales archaeon]